MDKKGNMHPAVKDLKSDLDHGRINRREFIRYSTLLGISAAAATQMAGMTWPGKAFASSPKRGGTMVIASPVHKVTHPAQFSWIAPSNQLRQVAEYLTYTDGENITHPYLLKNWQVSDDLKTWTLNLRQGITFNNGDEFTSDDVVFTINQWLDKDVGSSMKGLVGAYLSPENIEKAGKYQVILHLDKPQIGVPEDLFHYPALVLNHRTFEGDFIKEPHGTGPYLLEMYREGERCKLKRRDDYWKKGADGKKLPYMDSVEFIDMGTEMAPMIAAIKDGEIDSIDVADIGGTEPFQALKNYSGVTVSPIPTSQTRVLRMRVDLKPWDDNRVRQALKLCQHREKILQLAYFGEGLQGQDFHVYPGHPAYCEKPTPEFNPQKAKQLLKEAGYPDGVEVSIAVGSGWSEIVRFAEILKEDAKQAGFKININTMPNSQYWEKWTEVPLGITTWAHRPLATMVLNLGYSADAEGNPVPWNETKWVDPEFNKLLEEANGTLDVEERRKIFCKLEEIQQSRGSVGIAFWINVWMFYTNRVKNLEINPSLYYKLADVWLKNA